MNGYYQPCNRERNKPYSYLYPTYEDNDESTCSNYCRGRCVEYCDNPCNTTCNEHNQIDYCYCPHCLNGYADECTQDQYTVTEYEEYPRSECDNYYEKQGHCLHGHCNCFLNNSNQSNGYRVRGTSSTYRIPCDTLCQCNRERNNIYENSLWNEQIQSYNYSVLAENDIDRSREIPYSNISNLEANIDPTVISSPSTKDSYYTCIPATSRNIKMVYKNDNNISSKSTLNQTSLQSINQIPSKTILKKQNKPKNNSGYFEVVSPTHARHNHKKTSQSKPEDVSKSIYHHMSRKPVHYGYFEVKEKHYEDALDRLRSPDLDKIPTKISKQIDTHHLKKSTTLDKSLSANIQKPSIKTSDKSLTVDIEVSDRRAVTKSDIVKIFKALSKYQRHKLKYRNKMIQFDVNKSYSNINRRESLTNINEIQIVRSLSEGNIPSSTLNIQRSTENITQVRADENNHDHSVTDEELPQKKSIVMIYKSTNKSSSKIINQSKQKKIVTKAYPTAETTEDIDSEEVEIDSSDFDNRSLLSSSSDMKTAQSSVASSLNNSEQARFYSLKYGKDIVKNTVKENESSRSNCIKIMSNVSERESKRDKLNQAETKKASKSELPVQAICENADPLAIYRYSEVNKKQESDFQATLKSSFASKTSSYAKKPSKASNTSQDSGNKMRHSQDRIIRFNNKNLGIIKEESEPQASDTSLKLIHAATNDEPVSDFNWRHPSHYSVDYNNARMFISRRKRGNPSTRTLDSKYDEFQYDDSNMYRDCAKCPKKRYYTELESATIHNNPINSEGGQSYDKLFEYALQCPLYNRRGSNRRAHCNIKLSNIISFILFIVIFCGIFEYISVVVINGK